jgi:transcription termination factor 2
MQNEELHNLYYSPDIVRVFRSRRMRWAGHVARTGKMKNAYTILVGKREGMRPLGRPRHGRWEDNIKMDLRVTGFGGVDWINLAQDRDRWRGLVNTVMNLRVP